MSNGRCMMHGGKALAGIGSPSLSHGRYSKHIPTRLAAKYEESLNDERQLELRNELALIDAHVSDQLEAVSNGEAGELWKRLKQAWIDYRKAGEKDATTRLSEVGWLIEEGFQEALAWDSIRASVEQRRKLVDSESTRQAKSATTITEQQAMVLLGAVAAIIRRHVTDRNILSNIARDLSSLVANGSSGAD